MQTLPASTSRNGVACQVPGARRDDRARGRGEPAHEQQRHRCDADQRRHEHRREQAELGAARHAEQVGRRERIARERLEQRTGDAEAAARDESGRDARQIEVEQEHVRERRGIAAVRRVPPHAKVAHDEQRHMVRVRHVAETSPRVCIRSIRECSVDRDRTVAPAQPAKSRVAKRIRGFFWGFFILDSASHHCLTRHSAYNAVAAAPPNSAFVARTPQDASLRGFLLPTKRTSDPFRKSAQPRAGRAECRRRSGGRR